MLRVITAEKRGRDKLTHLCNLILFSMTFAPHMVKVLASSLAQYVLSTLHSKVMGDREIYYWALLLASKFIGLTVYEITGESPATTKLRIASTEMM